jgi:hypothetical protein
MSGPNFPGEATLPANDLGDMDIEGPFNWGACDAMNVTIIQQASTGLYSGTGEKVDGGATWKATLKPLAGSKPLVPGAALAHAEAIVDGGAGPEIVIWFNGITLKR